MVDDLPWQSVQELLVSEVLHLPEHPGHLVCFRRSERLEEADRFVERAVEESQDREVERVPAKWIRECCGHLPQAHEDDESDAEGEDRHVGLEEGENQAQQDKVDDEDDVHHVEI